MIIVVASIVLWLGIFRLFVWSGERFSTAVIATHVAWWCAVLVVFEGVSAATAMTSVSVGSALAAVSIIAACVAIGVRRRVHTDGAVVSDAHPAAPIVVSVGAWLATLLVALSAPPNTWDSMTYHMARVSHWLANGSIRPYPTNIMRQIHMGPLSELGIALTVLATGTDRFANLVQWVSYVISCVAVWDITDSLGFSVAGRATGMAIAATIPMAVVQASGTQNDLVATSVVLAAASILLRNVSRTRRVYGFLFAAAVALSVLTKASSALYVIPFAAWWLAAVWRRSGIRRAFVTACAGSAIVAAILLPNVLRNLSIEGMPLGPGSWDTATYLNGSVSLKSILSNGIRNAALHMGSPFPAVNAATYGFILGLHRGVGIDPNDPKTTWEGTRFSVPTVSYGEDDAGNTLHMAVLLVVIPLGFFMGGMRGHQRKAFLAATLAGAVLFAATLKWQPWHSRLHLPVFFLLASLVGGITATFGYVVRAFLVLTFYICAVPFVAVHASRPLAGIGSVLKTPRDVQYFAAAPFLREPYSRAMAEIRARRAHSVGLMISEDDWEYPFHAMLPAGTRVFHIGVRNPSSRYETAYEAPDVIVVSDGYRRMYGNVEPSGYDPLSSEAPLMLFVRRHLR